MDVTPAGPEGHGPLATSAGEAPATPPAPRTGAFGALRTRWLLAWVAGGVLLISGVAALIGELGAPMSEDLLGALFYLPIVAWIGFAVVRRGGVRLGALLRWPALGTYWFVVAGMLVVQFVFSLAAITLTELVAPWMDDSLAGVGQGNLLVALLGLAILPPLVEEVVFRGILLERFAVKWRVAVAVVASAVLFGILHADPVGAGMFGVVTGLLYLRTGSLWPGIIIHFVNNLVAVIAIQVTGSGATTPTREVSESLIAAGLFLALSLPFLVWFIWSHWPDRDALTPYQRYEIQAGLPPRTFRSVAWSGAGAPVAVEATSTHVIVSNAASPVAVLPLERVRSVYPSAGVGGTQVVILLNDGTWTTMQVPPGESTANRKVALTLSERAQFVDRRALAAPTAWDS